MRWSGLPKTLERKRLIAYKYQGAQNDGENYILEWNEDDFTKCHGWDEATVCFYIEDPLVQNLQFASTELVIIIT